MAEDLIELGIEAFDRGVDRYHDRIHDGVLPYARKVRLPGRRRKNGEVAVEEVTVQPQRASSESRAERNEEPRRRRDSRPDDLTDGEDLGYISDRPRRRRRDSNTRGNDSRGVPQRHPYPGEPPNRNDQTYPPPPRKSRSSQQLVAATAPAAALEYGYQQRPSIPLDNRPMRPRERNRDRDRDGRRLSPPRHHRSRRSRSTNDNALGASLAGALAGGLIGHQAGKGDVFSTAAGAIVGAFGGSIAAEKHQQSKDRRQYDDYRN